MKNLWRSIGAGLCVAGLLAAGLAQASLIIFDEDGNFTQDDSFTITSTGVQLDPTGPLNNGTGISTLEYLIAGDNFTKGWLAINDPDNGLSDLIHFAKVGSDTAVWFYSNDSGQLADHWPSSIPTVQATIVENANGIASYSPTGTQPGTYAFGAVTFEFISVPEPTTMSLTMIAGALLLPYGASRLRMLRKNR